MKWLRALGSRLAFVAGVLFGSALASFLWANGVTRGTALWALLSATSGVAAVAWRGQEPVERKNQALLALLALLTLGWVGAQLSRPEPRISIAYGSAWWQRVVDEEECTRAGLELTRLLRMTSATEADELRAVFARGYSQIPIDWRGGPNALLMTSGASLQVIPEGESRLPVVVFLHGFGGLLTPYVAMLARELGPEFIVIAPALDPVGAWWSDRGQAVIRSTVDALPERADRSRAFLVGLSNGGIGVTRTIQNEELRKAFAGFVNVSGIGPMNTGVPLEGVKVLVASGRDDERFPIAAVEARTDDLRAAGADATVLTLPASHALILSHAREWVSAFRRWAH